MWLRGHHLQVTSRQSSSSGRNRVLLIQPSRRWLIPSYLENRILLLLSHMSTAFCVGGNSTCTSDFFFGSAMREILLHSWSLGTGIFGRWSRHIVWATPYLVSFLGTGAEKIEPFSLFFDHRSQSKPRRLKGRWNPNILYFFFLLCLCRRPDFKFFLF